MPLLAEPSNAVDPASSVDLIALVGRCLGNFKIVERAIATFREAGETDLDELQSALDREDYESVIAISHRFKGAASNLSATGLSKLLLQAEHFGLQKDHASLTNIMEELRLAWEGFQRVANMLAPATNTVGHN